MDDDLDTNAAFYTLLQLAEALAAIPRFSTADRDRVLAAMKDFGKIFGVRFDRV